MNEQVSTHALSNSEVLNLIAILGANAAASSEVASGEVERVLSMVDSTPPLVFAPELGDTPVALPSKPKRVRKPAKQAAKPVAEVVAEPEVSPLEQMLTDSLNERMEESVALVKEAVIEDTVAQALVEIEAEIAEAVVAQVEDERAEVEAAVVAEIKLDALKAEIYADPVVLDASLNESVSPEDLFVAPRAPRTKRSKFAADDTSLAALEAAVGGNADMLWLEHGVTDYRQIDALAAHPNKKQRERIVNLYHWMGGKGALRIFTQQALDTLIDNNGVTREMLHRTYKSHKYADKTAASQVSHYWNLLQTMKCAELVNGELVENPLSIIMSIRRSERG